MRHDAAKVGPDELAEAIRRDVSELVSAPLGNDESKTVLSRFGRDFGLKLLEPADCADDRDLLAFSRARTKQLGVDGKALARGIGSVTAEQRGAAAKFFEPAQSAAVAAGGTIR